MGGLVSLPPLWPPQHQPGRATGREVVGCRLRHHWPGLPPLPLLRCLALRLVQTLGIAGHGRVTPRIPTRLKLPEALQGITVTGMPAFSERRVRGGAETAAAISAALALRQRLRAEVTIDGVLAHPQLLGDGPPGPPLLVQAPELLVERQPRCLAWVGSCPGRARRWWGGTGTATVPSGRATGAWWRAAWTASRVWR